MLHNRQQRIPSEIGNYQTVWKVVIFFPKSRRQRVKTEGSNDNKRPQKKCLGDADEKETRMSKKKSDLKWNKLLVNEQAMKMPMVYLKKMCSQ